MSYVDFSLVFKSPLFRKFTFEKNVDLTVIDGWMLNSKGSIQNFLLYLPITTQDETALLRIFTKIQ